ncbi:monocyte chemotactic protein 1B-like [Salminus brasiliensis]|uniref:monocyte chemotactic protein 1B-like n=1 Tax=Salminus brasiliensis TaxID=930266 RepID=UPI003B838E7A
MRTLSALLVMLLLASLQLTCRGTESTSIPVGCCFNFVKMKIPLGRITSYWRTSSNCPIKAVIFKTVIGKEFCADPSASWVQEHMNKLPTNKTSKS